VVYPAHILNNCIHNAAETLEIDVENIIFKIYQYFHIYTVRTEELKKSTVILLISNIRSCFLTAKEDGRHCFQASIVWYICFKPWRRTCFLRKSHLLWLKDFLNISSMRSTSVKYIHSWVYSNFIFNVLKGKATLSWRFWIAWTQSKTSLMNVWLKAFCLWKLRNYWP
jgi:hypothetical protein